MKIDPQQIFYRLTLPMPIKYDPFAVYDGKTDHIQFYVLPIDSKWIWDDIQWMKRERNEKIAEGSIGKLFIDKNIFKTLVKSYKRLNINIDLVLLNLFI
jgi:hypothetical protein